MFRGIIVEMPISDKIPIIPIYSLNPVTINLHFWVLKQLIITMKWKGAFLNFNFYLTFFYAHYPIDLINVVKEIISNFFTSTYHHDFLKDCKITLIKCLKNSTVNINSDTI